MLNTAMYNRISNALAIQLFKGLAFDVIGVGIASSKI